MRPLVGGSDLRASMRSNAVLRIRLISGAFVIGALIIIVRLFFVQIVQGNEYREKAQRQYMGKAGSVFDRGSIYFLSKDGKEIAAASLVHGFTVAIHPAQIPTNERERVYQELTRELTIEKSSFMEKASKLSDPYEEIASRVPNDVAERIRALSLPGVVLSVVRWRVYPSGSLAAHSIGFIGYHGSELSGRYGLEKQYEKVLGRETGENGINFFAELFSGLGKEAVGKVLPEGDIYLTIEPVVQDVAEKAAHALMESYMAEGAGIIIMEPSTGALRALAALPSYNPGEEKVNLNVLGNPLIERVYEMGSIIKPLTIAAAFDAEVLTRETTYNDKGFVLLNGARIENFDKKGRGVVPMQEVLNNSLNTGAVFAMQQLGRDRFRTYMHAYGFGDKTGVDLPDEVAGITSNLESTRDLEYATASFGQGIALTPLATTRALASLGNGGLIVKPYVVQEIRYKGGEKGVTNPTILRRVLKEETSEEITRMLITVYDKALAGGKYKMEHYSIAAKTGTAQISQDVKGYYEDQYLHSFFGYFPAYEPRFIVFLYILKPQGVRYASESLSEPFVSLAKFLINYYRIPPDR